MTVKNAQFRLKFPHVSKTQDDFCDNLQENFDIIL